MRGWHPFPLWDSGRNVPDELRARGKSHPPKGFTGRDGRNATRDELEAWRDAGRFFNLGTRMPVNVVAIDVDAYHGGDDTLRKLEKRLGKLPRTYTVTARADGSGHRYYAVPGKRVWRNPGTGIEILHWGWRYAVLPPSTHPETGTPYTWYGPDGAPLANQLGPKPEGLPALPAKWVEYLDTKADPNVSIPRVHLANAEMRELLESWTSDDEPCPHMRATLDEAFSTTTGGRHDACMRAQMKLIRYGEAGHPGGRTALKVLRNWFFTSVGTDRDPSGEWLRGITNAAQRIAANPTPPERSGCRAPALFDYPPPAAVPAPRVNTAMVPFSRATVRSQ